MSEITKFMLESIENAEGDFEKFSGVVRDNHDVYRTLEEYISSRIDKQELADRLGLTTTRAIDEWETKGMKFQRAMECAIALKLDFKEANEFFRKYAGMRSLYPASEQDFRLLYVLIYRERLEKQFPYCEKETVKAWMDRIMPQIAFLNEAEHNSKKDRKIAEEEKRIPTDTFLDILMEQDLEMLPQIKFRSAGEKALAYLEELVIDTPFEKYYGNHSANLNIDNADDQKNANDRNGSICLDLYSEEERGHYDLIRRKLKNGDIPHRDELIRFAMDMTLCLGKEEIDQLLIKSGYEPLMARDLYEGLLMTIYLYEEGLNIGDPKKCIEYTDFQVFVSEKVDEAISYLPEDETLLKEVPRWYLNEDQRRERMEKRCFSDMIFLMSEKMTRTWKNINRNIPVNISESTLRKAAAKQIRELKYHYLDQETYQTVWHMICRMEKCWVEVIDSGILKKMKREEYQKLFDEVLKELDDYYRTRYAQKKLKKTKKAKKEGEENDENGTIK